MQDPQSESRCDGGRVPAVLVIDNYDSFTYNLVQLVGSLGFPVQVARNDEIAVEQIAASSPTHIIISPGPGRPEDAGITQDVVRTFAGVVPLLGVCLGHQAIGAVFGGWVVRAGAPVHGKTSRISHLGAGVFCGLPQGFEATRYHSLVVSREGLPDCFEVTAWTEEGLIMGLRHRTLPRLEGVQFHPESIMTVQGPALLANFLK